MKKEYDNHHFDPITYRLMITYQDSETKHNTNTSTWLWDSSTLYPLPLFRDNSLFWGIFQGKRLGIRIIKVGNFSNTRDADVGVRSWSSCNARSWRNFSGTKKTSTRFTVMFPEIKRKNGLYMSCHFLFLCVCFDLKGKCTGFPLVTSLQFSNSQVGAMWQRGSGVKWGWADLRSRAKLRLLTGKVSALV